MSNKGLTLTYKLEKMAHLEEQEVIITKIDDDYAAVTTAGEDGKRPPLKMLLFTEQEIEFTFKILNEKRGNR